MRLTDEERFFSKVDITDDCWNWLAGKNQKGYGLFTWDCPESPRRKKGTLAHVWSYEHHFGLIPIGFEVDHQCHNDDPKCQLVNLCPHRACQQPKHLVLVPVGENAKKASSTRLRCRNGHLRTSKTVYRDPRDRQDCRQCAHENNARRIREQRIANHLLTHCARGHVFDEANTKIRANGTWLCRACDALRARERKAGLRGASRIVPLPSRG